MKYHGVTGWATIDDKNAEVIADTGWYDPDTNCDSTTLDGEQKVARYRLALINGDPHILKDWRGITVPGFTIDWKRGTMVRDTRPPYWETNRWCEHPLYGASHMLEGKHRTDYLHPRFTALKTELRKLDRCCRREARAARRKALA